MTRPNTSGSNITQRDVYFTPISSTNKNWTAAQHHLGCIRTRSNDGPRDNDQQRPTTRKGGDTDIWTINNEGHTASIHKRLRGAFSTSSVASPQVNARTPGRQSSNKQDNNQKQINGKLKDLSRQQQNRIIDGPAWVGEPWFKLNPRTSAGIPATTDKATAAKASQQEHAKAGKRAEHCNSRPQQTRHPNQHLDNRHIQGFLRGLSLKVWNKFLVETPMGIWVKSLKRSLHHLFVPCEETCEDLEDDLKIAECSQEVLVYR